MHVVSLQIPLDHLLYLDGISLQHVYMPTNIHTIPKIASICFPSQLLFTWEHISTNTTEWSPSHHWSCSLKPTRRISTPVAFGSTRSASYSPRPSKSSTYMSQERRNQHHMVQLFRRFKLCSPRELVNHMPLCVSCQTCQTPHYFHYIYDKRVINIMISTETPSPYLSPWIELLGLLTHDLVLRSTSSVRYHRSTNVLHSGRFTTS